MADPRLGPDQALPDTDHVVRYCGKTFLRESDGTPGPGAFTPGSDGYVSVYWLEFARIEDEGARWDDIRRRMRASGLKLRAQGKLAKLPVGPTRSGMLEEFGRVVQIKHMPVLDDGGPPPDEAHCGIHGLPTEDIAIGDFLANLVTDLKPAQG